jgi:hypothetical protein
MTRHVPTRISHTHGEPERYQYTNRKLGARKFNLKHNRAPLADTAEHGVVLARAAAERVGFSYGRTTANICHSCTPNQLTTNKNSLSLRTSLRLKRSSINCNASNFNASPILLLS